MKVKIFKSTVSGNIEETINKWFNKNGITHNQIINIKQSAYSSNPSSTQIIVSIFYLDKY